MQPLCALHNYMFSDVILCGTMSKLHIFVDLTYKAYESCKGLPVICHGLYVMHEGLSVMQRVCLSCATTAIVSCTSHNDVMIPM